MKHKVLMIVALLGSGVLELLGGWDEALQTLMIFMAVDWFTGGIILPVVFKKSPKSVNGALESTGIMGVPLPEALKKSIDILEEKNLAMKD